MRWSAPRRRRPALRSKFYDYLLQYRGPFAFGGMKRSRGPGMTFVDATRRSGRAGRHRAKLYGNSVSGLSGAFNEFPLKHFISWSITIIPRTKS